MGIFKERKKKKSKSKSAALKWRDWFVENASQLMKKSQ